MSSRETGSGPQAGFVESRLRLQAVADETRDSVQRVPDALRKATEAAREAFNETLRAQDPRDGTRVV